MASVEHIKTIETCLSHMRMSWVTSLLGNVGDTTPDFDSRPRRPCGTAEDANTVPRPCPTKPSFGGSLALPSPTDRHRPYDFYLRSPRDGRPLHSTLGTGLANHCCFTQRWRHAKCWPFREPASLSPPGPGTLFPQYSDNFGQPLLPMHISRYDGHHEMRERKGPVGSSPGTPPA